MAHGSPQVVRVRDSPVVSLQVHVLLLGVGGRPFEELRQRRESAEYLGAAPRAHASGRSSREMRGVLRSHPGFRVLVKEQDPELSVGRHLRDSPFDQARVYVINGRMRPDENDLRHRRSHWKVVRRDWRAAGRVARQFTNRHFGC